MSIDRPGSHISQDDEFHGSMHETIYKLYDTIPEAVKELNAGFNALRKHNLSSSECAQVSVNFKKCLDKIADFVRPEDKDLLETTFMDNPSYLRDLRRGRIASHKKRSTVKVARSVWIGKGAKAPDNLLYKHAKEVGAIVNLKRFAKTA